MIRKLPKRCGRTDCDTRIADSTQILTLTASQAIELGYCDGIAENINQIAVQYPGYSDYNIETYNRHFTTR